jgi:hypothetical protein
MPRPDLPTDPGAALRRAVEEARDPMLRLPDGTPVDGRLLSRIITAVDKPVEMPTDTTMATLAYVLALVAFDEVADRKDICDVEAVAQKIIDVTQVLWAAS